MAFAVKADTRVRAWELGAGSDMEKEMLLCGKIIAHPDGTYELFSLEATEEKGQMAKAGDYFKVDSYGCPYPIVKAYFLANHRHIQGDLYEQIPRPLDAWKAEDGMCDEIEYLIAHKGLVIDEASDDKYFTAPLYGAIESAARDAVIVFYELSRDKFGRISDIMYNFVDRKEFDRIYEWVK